MSFDGMMNVFGKIEKMTETEDANTGEKTKAWAVFKANVKGRLDQATGKEYASDDSILANSDHIWFIRNVFGINATSLDTKDYRVTIKNQVYNIMSIQDAGGHGHHLEILLQKID